MYTAAIGIVTVVEAGTAVVEGVSAIEAAGPVVAKITNDGTAVLEKVSSLRAVWDYAVSVVGLGSGSVAGPGFGFTAGPGPAGKMMSEYTPVSVSNPADEVALMVNQKVSILSEISTVHAPTQSPNCGVPSTICIAKGPASCSSRP